MRGDVTITLIIRQDEDHVRPRAGETSSSGERGGEEQTGEQETRHGALKTRVPASSFRKNQASKGGCISKRGMRAHTGRPWPVVPKNDPVAVLSALMTW